MGIGTTILKIKIALILAIVAIIGIVIFYTSIPISTSYLVEDVKTVQSSLDYKSGFQGLVNPSFLSNATSNNTDMSNLRNAVVEVAKSQVGTEEKKNSFTNDIKYNYWYNSMNGISLRSQYCAIFTLWCFNELGLWKPDGTVKPGASHNMITDSGRCTIIALDAYSVNRFVLATSDYVPRAGDLVIFSKGVRDNNALGYEMSHIGIVTGADAKFVNTIEGNTSPSGVGSQDAGDGVYAKQRNRIDHSFRVDEPTVFGYAIPIYPGEEEFNAPNGIPF